MMRKFILSYVILMSINNIFAQKTIKDSIQQLNEVVVTAQYSPRSEKNSIYKVKIINNKTIEVKAATNLTELLRQELNIDFSYNAIFGAGIEMNGVSKENIKVLIDGVPLIGRVNGVLNLNQINLDNVDHIEIIEGPVSVFYGTDALGGIINIITKKNQKNTVEGSMSGFYETVEAKELTANIGLKDGKNIFKFGAGYSYFNGLNTDEDNTRSLNWPKNRKYNKSFKYLRKMGDYKLQFTSDFSDELLKTLGEVHGTKATDIDYDISRFDNTLNFQGNVSKDKFIDITFSYLDYDREDTSYKFNTADNSTTLIENNPNANANYFDTFFAKGQYAQNNSDKKLNYVLGAEFVLDKGRGNRILNSKQSVQTISTFGSVNYKLNDAFEIQPAIRFTNNESFGNLWSPALNIKYRINSNNVLRFSYGRGFRAPSLKELFLDWTPQFGPVTYIFRGNQNLKLESSHNFNLYYSYSKLLTSKSSIIVEPFITYNQIHDLIGLSELVTVGSPMDFTQERHYINLNGMKSTNISVQTTYKLDNLKINLGISYLGRYLEYSDEFNSGNFMFTPAISSTIFYHIKPINLNLNIFYKYSGKRKGHFIEEVSGVDVLQKTTRDDFSNLDISLNKSFLNKKIALIIGAKNIFNVTNVETFNQIGVAHERDIQLWGSSYFIKTTIRF